MTDVKIVDADLRKHMAEPDWRHRGAPGGIGFDRFLFRHTIARPFETLLDCADVRRGGLLDEPRGRGIGRAERGSAPAKKKPSEYMRADNRFYATEPEQTVLPYILAKIGADVILFASGCSHWDGGFLHNITTRVNRLSDVTEKQKNKITRRNAIRLYGWAH